ncbi:hypothetical protein G6011_10799 [Alternaria panax]|uniref:Uncharacterized protein n=1 Tax=Alternaria panax TaxID=48097 RepID=A0AAD4ICF9_9PLEO|nr:hypothetical protein G6011_10799 [Alternaria panax]
MPPKQMTGKGRTLNEPSFASSAVSAFTTKENRSIVTAAGMFAVRYPGRWKTYEEGKSMIWNKENCGNTSANGGPQIGVAFLHSSWAEILLPAR